MEEKVTGQPAARLRAAMSYLTYSTAFIVG
jgi:hypothetical protein